MSVIYIASLTHSGSTLLDLIAGGITIISLNNTGVVLNAAQFQSKGITFNSTLTGSVTITLNPQLVPLRDPGDEIVCGWPSFPSYVIYARKQAAGATLVPLREGRYDLDALLAAVTPRTKLVYVCEPNNPTGTMTSRAELDAYFARVPEHVVTVVDQAYFEYIEDPDYPDAVAEYARRGHRVVVLRCYGSAPAPPPPTARRPANTAADRADTSGSRR